MQIVIDIPEEAYELLQNKGVDWLGAEHILDAVAKGTPLPEHHGRLIDADVLVEGMEDDYEFCEAVNATPTIIPATKEEKRCTDCKWYGFTCECPVHCTQDTKIAWESATKEGDGE